MAYPSANQASWNRQQRQARTQAGPNSGDRTGFQYANRPTYNPYTYTVPTPQAAYTPTAAPNPVNWDDPRPWHQAQQNANQWAAEFGEGNQRWNQQWGWQQAQDQFNMGLTAQQQAMAEWQAQQQMANWLDQFSYQQQRDQWEQGFAGQQLEQAREAARWNTFGRNQTPNFRWMRSW